MQQIFTNTPWQVRMPKASGSAEGRELYPLDTNLLKTPVAGMLGLLPLVAAIGIICCNWLVGWLVGFGWVDWWEGGRSLWLLWFGLGDVGCYWLWWGVVRCGWRGSVWLGAVDVVRCGWERLAWLGIVGSGWVWLVWLDVVLVVLWDVRLLLFESGQVGSLCQLLFILYLLRIHQFSKKIYKTYLHIHISSSLSLSIYYIYFTNQVIAEREREKCFKCVTWTLRDGLFPSYFILQINIWCWTPT